MNDWFSFGWSLIEQGGPFMWPLLGVSVFGLTVFIERAVFLHRGQIGSGQFLDGIHNLLQKRRLVEALTVCEETPGPIPEIVKAAILHYDDTEEECRRAITSAALVEIPLLERRIGTVSALARIAPLLGLVGTLLSFLQSFGQLQAEGPYANMADYSAYIYQALITTIFGLGIGIMAYLGFYFLQGRYRAVLHDMELAGHSVLQWLKGDSKKANLPDGDIQ